MLVITALYFCEIVSILDTSPIPQCKIRNHAFKSNAGNSNVFSRQKILCLSLHVYVISFETETRSPSRGANDTDVRRLQQGQRSPSGETAPHECRLPSENTLYSL